MLKIALQISCFALAVLRRVQLILPKLVISSPPVCQRSELHHAVGSIRLRLWRWKTSAKLIQRKWKVYIANKVWQAKPAFQQLLLDTAMSVTMRITLLHQEAACAEGLGGNQDPDCLQATRLPTATEAKHQLCCSHSISLPQTYGLSQGCTAEEREAKTLGSSVHTAPASWPPCTRRN